MTADSDPAYILITDTTTGLQVGCNQAGNLVDTIPGAIVINVRPWAPTPCSGGTEVITIPPPLATHYDIQIYSVGSSNPYAITFVLADSNDNLQGRTVFSGTVTQGAPESYAVAVGSPGSVLSVSSVSAGPLSAVYGNVTWTTPTFQGLQYIFPATVSINGQLFSSTFYESLFAQFKLVIGLPYAGYYNGTFWAISGCQQGSNITLTVSIKGVVGSGTVACPAPGNTKYINLSFSGASPSFYTSSIGTKSNGGVAPVALLLLLVGVLPMAPLCVRYAGRTSRISRLRLPQKVRGVFGRIPGRE
jgi:hypothetical protein